MSLDKYISTIGPVDNAQEHVTEAKKHMSLLIVDDEALVLMLIREYLGSLGYENFTTAHRGDLALEVLETRTIDAVWTDYELPGATGLEIAKKALDQGIPKHMIVSASGRYGVEEIRIKVCEYAGEVAPKPFTSEFYAKVDQSFTKGILEQLNQAKYRK